jgi:hypothetical protein
MECPCMGLGNGIDPPRQAGSAEDNERNKLVDLSAASKAGAAERRRHPDRAFVSGALIFRIAGFEMAGMIAV